MAERFVFGSEDATPMSAEAAIGYRPTNPAVEQFEDLLERQGQVHQCPYGDTNGDGDCPHGFREFEVIERG